MKIYILYQHEETQANEPWISSIVGVYAEQSLAIHEMLKLAEQARVYTEEHMCTIEYYIESEDVIGTHIWN